MANEETWKNMTPDDAHACDVCEDKPARNCGGCGATLCHEHATDDKGAHHAAGCVHKDD